MELSSITNRIWVIILLIVLCVLVGYFFTLNVYGNVYVAANDQLDLLKEKNASLRQNLDTIDTFIDNYETRKSDAQTTELALPAKSSDVPNILAGLGDLAAASGVVLSTFNIDEPEDTDLGSGPNSIQTINISLGGSGTYASLEDFISRLEKHLRLMDVQTLSVSEQGENDNLNYKISLKTYFQK